MINNHPAMRVRWAGEGIVAHLYDPRQKVLVYNLFLVYFGMNYILGKFFLTKNKEDPILIVLLLAWHQKILFILIPKRHKNTWSKLCSG